MELSTKQYNEAVDLWNAGKTLKEISELIKLPFYDLHPILRAATREAMASMRRGEDDENPVKLTKIE